MALEERLSLSLFERCTTVSRIVQKQLGRDGQIDDLPHDLWLYFVRREKNPPDYVLFLKARQLVIDRHRKDRSVRHASEHLDSLPDDRPSPIDYIISRELIDRLLPHLSVPLLEVLERMLAGASIEEIASELGISLFAARARRHRLIGIARAVLGDD